MKSHEEGLQKKKVAMRSLFIPFIREASGCHGYRRRSRGRDVELNAFRGTGEDSVDLAGGGGGGGGRQSNSSRDRSSVCRAFILFHDSSHRGLLNVLPYPQSSVCCWPVCVPGCDLRPGAAPGHRPAPSILHAATE